MTSGMAFLLNLGPVFAIEMNNLLQFNDLGLVVNYEGLQTDAGMNLQGDIFVEKHDVDQRIQKDDQTVVCLTELPLLQKYADDVHQILFKSINFKFKKYLKKKITVKTPISAGLINSLTFCWRERR